MSTVINIVKDQADPKIYKVFERLAGKKLERVCEVTLDKFNNEEKEFHRAMADALEVLGL